MDDDFNTSGAIAVLFSLAKALQRQGNILVHQGQLETNADQLQRQWHTLVQLAGVLGLEAEAQANSPDKSDLSDVEINALIKQRTAAKKDKNYAESDRIRDELNAQGITLIDKPGGITDWHR